MSTLYPDRVRGGLFGVCVGDALGLSVEGASRSYMKRHPVTGMGSSEEIPAGWWSDDSSLTLCLAQSISDNGRVVLVDIADRFRRWLYDGYWTPSGRAFGIGATTLHAIERLRSGVPPLVAGGREEFSNGNGSLMRILPLGFALMDAPFDECMKTVHDVSSITHAHPRSHIACGIYVQLCIFLLKGMNPRDAYNTMQKKVRAYYRKEPYRSELVHFSRLLDSDIGELSEDAVVSSGYVVDTLEASIWCILRGGSYEETVLRAVNLGGDSDTTGAVSGGLSGLFLGYGSIPERWIAAVARNDDIDRLACSLAALHPKV